MSKKRPRRGSTRPPVAHKHVQREHHRITVEPLQPLNETQADYIECLKHDDQVISLGPAGTGKSYIASTMAADMLALKKIDKIILTRPNVPVGRSLGFFPGELEEKFAPWAAQIIHDMKQRLGASRFEAELKAGKIEMVPFEVMRGRSWDRAFILLDEAQNTTPEEMKMFLTRIGKYSKVVINGDIKQSDIKGTSGLRKIIDLIDKRDLPVPVVEFTIDDIVRSDICAMWIKAFS
jgi:phosphate starvation-inducible protein PhoH and related proteins